MLRLVTKEDFWCALDDGFMLSDSWDMDHWRNFSIKQIQDAVLLSLLRDANGLDILEIGGGHSRTLPHLCQRNRCTNADPVEGMGHGPVGVDPSEVPWRHVFRAAGDLSAELPDASFDVVYSISVLEHVPADAWDLVWEDMARVLKPGGRMVHLVDVYLADFDRKSPRSVSMANALRDRLERALKRADMKPAGAIVSDAEMFFRGAYATNPDLIMHTWNQMAPVLKEFRAEAQGCSFLLEATKA